MANVEREMLSALQRMRKAKSDREAGTGKKGKPEAGKRLRPKKRSSGSEREAGTGRSSKTPKEKFKSGDTITNQDIEKYVPKAKAVPKQKVKPKTDPLPKKAKSTRSVVKPKKKPMVVTGNRTKRIVYDKAGRPTGSYRVERR